MFRIEVLVTKKVDPKMGVQDLSLKMVRNALEETNEWKTFTCSKNERSTVVPSKVRGGKLKDVWIRDKDV